MVVYKGYKTGLMYKMETTWGTPVTVDTAIEGKVTSFSSEWANNLIREQGLGEGRNYTTSVWGGFDIGGTIEGAVGRFDFFEALVGQRSGAGTAASPYLLTEASSIGTSGIESFTMQAFCDESTDMVDTFAGCVLNNCTFTATEGDVLRFSADWVGKTVATNTSGETYSADTTALWNFAQGALKWGSSPTEETKVTSFSITFANNMFIYRALGDRFIQQPEPGLLRYDFTLTCKLNDTNLGTLQQDLMGQANSPHTGISAATPTTSNEIQLYFEGPTNQKAWIQFDEAVIDSMSKPIDLGGGVIEVTFTGFAQKGLSNEPIKWQTSA